MNLMIIITSLISYVLTVKTGLCSDAFKGGAKNGQNQNGSNTTPRKGLLEPLQPKKLMNFYKNFIPDDLKRLLPHDVEQKFAEKDFHVYDLFSGGKDDFSFAWNTFFSYYFLSADCRSVIEAYAETNNITEIKKLLAKTYIKEGFYIVEEALSRMIPLYRRPGVEYPRNFWLFMYEILSCYDEDKAEEGDLYLLSGLYPQNYHNRITKRESPLGLSGMLGSGGSVTNSATQIPAKKLATLFPKPPAFKSQEDIDKKNKKSDDDAAKKADGDQKESEKKAEDKDKEQKKDEKDSKKDGKDSDKKDSDKKTDGKETDKKDADDKKKEEIVKPKVDPSLTNRKLLTFDESAKFMIAVSKMQKSDYERIPEDEDRVFFLKLVKLVYVLFNPSKKVLDLDESKIDWAFDIDKAINNKPSTVGENVFATVKRLGGAFDKESQDLVDPIKVLSEHGVNFARGKQQKDQKKSKSKDGSDDEEEKESNVLLQGLLIVGGIIAVAAIAYGIYYFVTNKSS